MNTLTDAQKKVLRLIKVAARGVSVNGDGKVSAIIANYNLTQFSNFIQILAERYRAERHAIIEDAAQSGALGSAETYNVEAQIAGGFGGGVRLSRPRLPSND
jgi:hypothetical protein